jgi:hypothetical protein
MCDMLSQSDCRKAFQRRELVRGCATTLVFLNVWTAIAENSEAGSFNRSWRIAEALVT